MAVISKNTTQIDEDAVDYETFSKHLNDWESRQKNIFSNEIELIGEELIDEIQEKIIRNNLTKIKYVKYILNRDKNHQYTKKMLMKYSLADVLDIHNEIKIKSESTIKKYFRFLFNVKQ